MKKPNKKVLEEFGLKGYMRYYAIHTHTVGNLMFFKEYNGEKIELPKKIIKNIEGRFFVIQLTYWKIKEENYKTLDDFEIC